MKSDSIDEALTALAAGRMVVVVDDESRENEGDLILAAEHASAESLAFMVRHGSGVICVALPGERLDALALPLMVANNTESMGTAYTVTVDYRHGTSTGISAADRAATLRALVEPTATAADFNRPGHMFPLRARAGGVLSRPGHTEAAVDLTCLAGLRCGGALVEIVNDDGSMARRPELQAFAERHGLPLITICDLVAYRKHIECSQDDESGCGLSTPLRPTQFTQGADSRERHGFLFKVQALTIGSSPCGLGGWRLNRNNPVGEEHERSCLQEGRNRRHLDQWN
jgi:3,4-dihydroxy 2-butanone 4-phosphate synthase / GTP cyclohydrolase II